MSSRGLFITGTDTDVGKTYVGCLLVQSLVNRGLRLGVYKPVASGFRQWSGSDGDRLWQAARRPGAIEHVTPQLFSAPLAPPIAAKHEGRCVDKALILRGYEAIRSSHEYHIVEGAGGLLSPISDTWTNADLILRWGLPVVIVTAWKLGVVSQVLTTLVACRSLGIDVECVVLNACAPNPEASHYELLINHMSRRGFEHIPVTKVDFGSTEFGDQRAPFAARSDAIDT
jgi:dethiobiotin synthetase